MPRKPPAKPLDAESGTIEESIAFLKGLLPANAPPQDAERMTTIIDHLGSRRRLERLAGLDASGRAALVRAAKDAFSVPDEIRLTRISRDVWNSAMTAKVQQRAVAATFLRVKGGAPLTAEGPTPEKALRALADRIEMCVRDGVLRWTDDLGLEASR